MAALFACTTAASGGTFNFKRGAVVPVVGKGVTAFSGGSTPFFLPLLLLETGRLSGAGIASSVTPIMVPAPSSSTWARAAPEKGRGLSLSSPGRGEYTVWALRCQRGTEISGSRAGWVPGLIPIEREVSCSRIAWSRSRICRSAYGTELRSVNQLRRRTDERPTESYAACARLTFSCEECMASSSRTPTLERILRAEGGVLGRGGAGFGESEIAFSEEAVRPSRERLVGDRLRELTRRSWRGGVFGVDGSSLPSSLASALVSVWPASLVVPAPVAVDGSDAGSGKGCGVSIIMVLSLIYSSSRGIISARYPVIVKERYMMSVDIRVTKDEKRTSALAVQLAHERECSMQGQR